MSLESLIEKRDKWKAAEDAVIKGQNYSIDGMSVSRVDAETITMMITKYNREIREYKRIQDGGGQASRAVWS